MRERLLFVGLLIAAAATVPLFAFAIRSRLARRRQIGSDEARSRHQIGSGETPGRLQIGSGERRRRLLPVHFGDSPRSRRSPRHAVLLHRGLVGAFFMALLALCLIPAVAALPALGVRAIPVAFAFVLPTLLVTLQTRRASLRE